MLPVPEAEPSRKLRHNPLAEDERQPASAAWSVPVVPPVREDSESATGACAGEVLSQWGAGEFLLPHMITVDKESNVWTTDVALHVATKWSPSGKKLLELGERLVPGHDRQHLCKPTQVPALHALPQLCTCF